MYSKVGMESSRIEATGRGQAGRVKLCVEEGRSDSCEYYDRLYTE